MLNNISNLNKLTYLDYQRYAKQIVIENIKTEGQSRLKSAKIICVGAGGLSAPIMMYLTACGVGEIGIIDNDVIELSNLQRQIIYKYSDINKKKAETARNYLASLNQSTKIKKYNKKLTRKNILRIIARYEIIIDGTDDFKSRYLISQSCYKMHKIHVYGAIEKFTGQVSVFNYQNSTSYYNLLNKISYKKIKRCNETGVVNTLAGITGLLQATEAIKIITGIGEVFHNKLIVFNCLHCSLDKIRIKPYRLLKQKVLGQQVQKENLRMSYDEIKEIINKPKVPYALVDIRTEIEFKTWHLDNAINIPLSKLKTKKGIKEMEQLIDRYNIVIYCSNTGRSHIASQILKRESIKHYILSK